MRVAIGGIHTECSTYSPLRQYRADFTRSEGQGLVDLAGIDFAAHGITPLPIFHDRSLPGGPVDPGWFATQLDEFITLLRAAMPLDGVLLLMHGGYIVPGIDDPEADFVEAVRAVVGPDVVISSAWDLHGNISDRVTDAVDAFAALRTAPHIDYAETRQRAGRMLIEALAGGPRPVVLRHPIPLLVSGERCSTLVDPCRGLYAALPEFDARPGICDANLMAGYVWADTARACAAAIVTCTDRDAGRLAAQQIAARYWDCREDLDFNMETAPLATLLDSLDGPTILADSGDNPTGGGVGDRADVLAALLGRGWQGHAVIAGIAAPGAIETLRSGAAQVQIGAELGGGGPRVTLVPDAVRMVGPDAVLSIGGIELVLTHRRRPFHYLANFAALGLDPICDLLVVKSGYLAPELHALPIRRVMALTDGAVPQDMAALANLHRPRPTWPFQR